MIRFILHKLKLQFEISVGFHSTLISFVFEKFSYHSKSDDLHSYKKNIIFLFRIYLQKNCHYQNECVI